mmetsp:Transcript_48745/g.135636  ORF Transcript_48745/g.135636 Transcript_48745/m.135636 type:complete len:254 (-) Transcript_48745:490-1251(-)
MRICTGWVHLGGGSSIADPYGLSPSWPPRRARARATLSAGAVLPANVGAEGPQRRAAVAAAQRAEDLFRGAQELRRDMRRQRGVEAMQLLGARRRPLLQAGADACIVREPDEAAKAGHFRGDPRQEPGGEQPEAARLEAGGEEDRPCPDRRAPGAVRADPQDPRLRRLLRRRLHEAVHEHREVRGHAVAQHHAGVALGRGRAQAPQEVQGAVAREVGARLRREGAGEERQVAFALALHHGVDGAPLHHSEGPL